MAAVALAGFAASVALIFSSASTAGFALAGPFGFFPYCLMCIAFSKPPKWLPPKLFVPGIAFGVFSALIGLAWPFIVLFT